MLIFKGAKHHKVTLTGHTIVPRAALEIVPAELATHITLTCEELGCVIFEVSQDTEDKTNLITSKRLMIVCLLPHIKNG